jgi:FKBP-type peptidyl-prolyl cis-trans isomerase
VSLHRAHRAGAVGCPVCRTSDIIAAMKRRFSAIAIPVLVLGTFAWVYAQTTAPSDTGAGGDKVVTKSGLTIITMKKGEPAKEGDTVSVLYVGRVLNGAQFDASSLHGNEPIKVTIGKTKVIQGWHEGLTGVQLGEKRKLIIPPELGYGAAGRGNAIPPNATLEFDVEIVGLTKEVQPQQP